MSIKLSVEDLILTANTIRGLSMDGVQSAKSGHPGMPMGMADVATVLFLEHLEHYPENPIWKNRDRFILSAGHGSMLLYSLLHLSGYELPLSELRLFRQWKSKTPGHPEVGHTPGVETTTGPLGQGCGNAVGMAIAERMLAERFNIEEYRVIDHYTYVMCGDGDLMEGLSHESFSLAGHLGLNKLILFYDSNRITIEGSTDLACSDNVKKRFLGYNWNVLEIDAHNFEEIDKAIRKAKREKNRPTIIVSHSHIGEGSPNKVDTASAHGSPFGEEEVRASKKNLGLPENEDFFVSERVRELFNTRLNKLKRKHTKWEKTLKKYFNTYPDKAEKWKKCFEDIIPDNIEDFIPEFDDGKPLATRSASGKVIQGITQAVPHLVGGSADLAPSTKTLIEDTSFIKPGFFGGRNFHFGVREHAMGAIMNGIALHGGFRIFGATFFVFSDYFRPAIRLAAIMNLPVIYIFTHDSFYVGEDGPTHQPVEQLSALRCIPGLTVLRPSDPTETGSAWIAALKNKTGPTAILLTRQNLDVIDRSKYPVASNLEKGAYVLWQSGNGIPDVILIASGSEVNMALQSAREVSSEYNVRVVSMPSWELFEKQDKTYCIDVLPPSCTARLAIEAGVSMGWRKYIGDKGKILCIDHFGSSASFKVLVKEFGFTVQNIVSIVRKMKTDQLTTG